MQQNFPKDAEQLLRSRGIDPNNLQSSQANKLLQNLNQQDAEKIRQLLSNKEDLNRLLQSDAAKQIMRQLFGKNGVK